MKYLFRALIFSLPLTVFGNDNPALTTSINKLTHLAMQHEVLQHAIQHDGKIDLTEIFSREDLWMASNSKPIHLLYRPLQYYFQDIIDQPGSPFVELILMGSQGETLAAFPTPSDYWQGDEAKFINVMADESVFVDQLNWDDSTQTISAQISVPVKDQSGEMFGVLTGAIEASLGDLSQVETK